MISGREALDRIQQSIAVERARIREPGPPWAATSSGTRRAAARRSSDGEVA